MKYKVFGKDFASEFKDIKFGSLDKFLVEVEIEDSDALDKALKDNPAAMARLQEAAKEAVDKALDARIKSLKSDLKAREKDIQKVVDDKDFNLGQAHKLQSEMEAFFAKKRDEIVAEINDEANEAAVNEVLEFARKSGREAKEEVVKRTVKSGAHITLAVAQIGGSAASIGVTHGAHPGTDVVAGLSIIQGFGKLGKELRDWAIGRERLLKQAERRLSDFVEAYEKERKLLGKVGHVAGGTAKSTAAGVASNLTGGLSKLFINSVSALKDDLALLEQKTAWARLRYNDLAKEIPALLDKQEELQKTLEDEGESGKLKKQIKKLEEETHDVLTKVVKFGDFIGRDEEFIKKFADQYQKLKSSPTFTTMEYAEKAADVAVTGVRLVAGQLANDWGSMAEGILAGLEIMEASFEISEKIAEHVAD